jgi:GNAT superfamily N-acetyltransferase
MTEADVAAAVDLWHVAFSDLATRFHLGSAPRTAASERRLTNRIRHFLASDPEGSFVADEDGSVVGFSQSFVREGYWVLSLLATSPRCQQRGVGRALLEAALATASPEGPGTIQSSRDPAAMALYASAGFSLHPAVMGDGPVRRPPPSDPWVREGGSGDFDLVGEVDRAVRGAARSEDVAVMLAEPGNRLLVIGREGYAVATDDRLVTLAARNEDVACALLRTVLAGIPAGGNIEVGWLTSGQQWAVRTLVEAGVALHPYGAVMVRGMAGPPRPYVPSGGYG